MVTYDGSREFRGARFRNVDMSGADFRDVILSGARMRGVLLTGVDIDGDIANLRINGVEVAPLVQAERERRHPELRALRPATADAAREAWAMVESLWAETTARAAALPDADRHRSVDEEWSFVQTLRHLVFVTDGWLSDAVLGRPRPFHPLALPPDFLDGARLGIDTAVTPSFDDVCAARADRQRQVREFLTAADDAELTRVREPNPVPGYPPPQQRRALDCIQVILDEEWEHRRIAVRDLDVIASGG
mgnify:CR=1 FL=1